MSDQLFDLSIKTAESLTIYLAKKNNAKEVRENMYKLLGELKLACPGGPNSDFEGYWENVCKKEGYNTLEYLQDDIGYYSDRWCYERYKTVERKWNLLNEKIS